MAVVDSGAALLVVSVFTEGAFALSTDFAGWDGFLRSTDGSFFGSTEGFFGSTDVSFFCSTTGAFFGSTEVPFFLSMEDPAFGGAGFCGLLVRSEVCGLVSIATSGLVVAAGRLAGVSFGGTTGLTAGAASRRGTGDLDLDVVSFLASEPDLEVGFEGVFAAVEGCLVA